jgi:RNA polymerase sigma-70 factor (ECF subfamily)
MVNYKNTENELLVARAKTGTALDVYKLWQKHEEWIDRLVKTNIQNEVEAEMAVIKIQDKFVKGIKNFQGKSSFKTYLYKIVKNAITDYYRKPQSTVKTISLKQAENIPASQKDENEQAQIERVRKVLAQLKPDLNEVLNLRFFQGFTIKETAELMGKSESTIKRLTDTAILQFRNLY